MTTDLRHLLHSAAGATPPNAEGAGEAMRRGRRLRWRRRAGTVLPIVLMVALVATLGRGILPGQDVQHIGPAGEPHGGIPAGTPAVAPDGPPAVAPDGNGAAGTIQDREQGSGLGTDPDTPPSSGSSGAAPTRTGRIASVDYWGVHTNTDISVVDLATGHRTQLTTTPEDELNPAWSPDGSTVAYDTHEMLFSVRADGSGLRLLYQEAGCHAYSPTWSPDGKRIAFVLFHHAACRGDAGTSDPFGWGELMIIDADGSNLRHVTGAPGAESVDDSPAWSPDGKTIAYSSATSGVPSIWLFDLSSRHRSWICSACDAAAWSPDGRRIAFTSYERDPDDSAVQGHIGGRTLSVINADGTGYRALHTASDRSNSPTWSPNGEWIAFSRELCEDPDGCGQGVDSGGRWIWVVRPDGSGLTKLTHGECCPSWGPSAS